MVNVVASRAHVRLGLGLDMRLVFTWQDHPSPDIKLIWISSWAWDEWSCQKVNTSLMPRQPSQQTLSNDPSFHFPFSQENQRKERRKEAVSKGRLRIVSAESSDRDMALTLRYRPFFSHSFQTPFFCIINPLAFERIGKEGRRRYFEVWLAGRCPWPGIYWESRRILKEQKKADSSLWLPRNSTQWPGVRFVFIISRYVHEVKRTATGFHAWLTRFFCHGHLEINKFPSPVSCGRDRLA